MNTCKLAGVAAISCLLAACGGAPADQSGTQEPAAQAESTAPEPVEAAETAVAAAPDKGQIAFLKCRSCHTLEEGGVHLTGPNLHGLLGASAGMKDGYVFSDALAGSGITWDAETLDAWIESPRDFVPGNKMAFAGIPDADQRAALIAYLERETQ